MKNKRGQAMRFISLVSVCVGMMLASGAHADPRCVPSTTVRTTNYPGARAIPATNNLLLPAGKAVPATGQQLTITGRVVDTHCAPVTHAIVELWQNSPSGRWLLAGRDDLASAGPIFAGAGRTYTDTDGNFTFITGFPAPQTSRMRAKKGSITITHAPRVYVKVTGDGIADLATALYFSGDARNAQDKEYTSLSSKARSDTLVQMGQGEGDTLTGTVQLVIAGRAPYRTY